MSFAKKLFFMSLLACLFSFSLSGGHVVHASPPQLTTVRVTALCTAGTPPTLVAQLNPGQEINGNIFVVGPGGTGASSQIILTDSASNTVITVKEGDPPQSFEFNPVTSDKITACVTDAANTGYVDYNVSNPCCSNGCDGSQEISKAFAIRKELYNV